MTEEPHLKEDTAAPESDPTTIELALIREKLSEAQKAADALKNQLLRKAAEFENYRKRVEAESASLMRYANEKLLAALVPVLDDFQRSLKAGREQRDFDSFLRGVELISTKFARTLENEGLVPFDSTGKLFDVAFHDALLQIPRADVPPHTVIEEVERGYLLGDRVLRHAKVIVSSSPETPADTDVAGGSDHSEDPNG